MECEDHEVMRPLGTLPERVPPKEVAKDPLSVLHGLAGNHAVGRLIRAYPNDKAPGHMRQALRLQPVVVARALSSAGAPSVSLARVPVDPDQTPEVDQVGSPSNPCEAAIAYAFDQIGDPYVYGAKGPDSWDCSGLVMIAFQQCGVQLPRTTAGQFAATTPIKGDPVRGDLVFYSSGKGPYHVGIYLGEGALIDAPHTGDKVRVRPVWDTPTYRRCSPPSK